MGISNLMRLIQQYAPRAITEVDLGAFKDKTLAIDTVLFMYKYKSRNEDICGKFSEMISRMKMFSVKPIFVFDGAARAEKERELQERRLQKHQHTEDQQCYHQALILADNTKKQWEHVFSVIQSSIENAENKEKKENGYAESAVRSSIFSLLSSSAPYKLSREYVYALVNESGLLGKNNAFDIIRLLSLLSIPEFGGPVSISLETVAGSKHPSPDRATSIISDSRHGKKSYDMDCIAQEYVKDIQWDCRIQAKDILNIFSDGIARDGNGVNATIADILTDAVVEEQGSSEQAAVNIKNKIATSELQTTRISKEEIQQCRSFLESSGHCVMSAKYDGEGTCAQMCAKGLVDAVVTEDTDVFPFGAHTAIRLWDSAHSTVQMVSLPVILETMKLTMPEFIDLCILCGCDFCPRLSNIGYVRAVFLIREYRRLEKVVERLQRTKEEQLYYQTTGFHYTQARKVFTEPVLPLV
jgi:5'-3' exonuclease